MKKRKILKKCKDFLLLQLKFKKFMEYLCNNIILLNLCNNRNKKNIPGIIIIY